MSNKYSVKIGQVEIALEGDADYIAAERDFVFEKILSPALKVLETPVSNYNTETTSNTLLPQSEVDKSAVLSDMSINEFLKEKSPQTLIDKAVCLIYFYEKGGRETVTGAELKKDFVQAKEQAPSNPSAVLAELVKKSYLMAATETGQKGAYKLTNTGISYVESFVAVSNVSRKPQKKSKKKRTEKVSD
ncbi:MAG: hypothetical protein IJS09_06140 [Treponema sp.]|nr:hypothetical protein [Treponema sp.]